MDPWKRPKMSSSSSESTIVSSSQSLEKFRPTRVKSVLEHEGLYGKSVEESRRLSLISTITTLQRVDYDEILNFLSRELSRESTYTEGEFKLQLDEFNFEQILDDFAYFSKKQGIKLRSSGITIRDLNVYGNNESFAIVPTVLDILKGPFVSIKKIIVKSRTPNRNLLHNLNGFARPGEMVLVLGRPGAGCTTFLKAISGTDFDLYKGVEGEILYDGIHQSEMLKSFKNDLIYNPELDCHFPHLTVDQTLTFALSCKTPNLRINGVSRSQFIEAQKIILATVFGLKHTFHTKVGNDFVRGVSGGERKRVSIAEALACNGSLYCWDNATRGLDASTALEFTEAIRTSTKLLHTTAFTTIYQAGENIYERFDKVTVLYRGKQIYFGPRDKAKRYFENMGWECPPRQTTPEFLTAITDPIGRYPRQGYENKVPQTAEEFEAYWLKSPEYRKLIREIDEYNTETDEDETRRNYYESLKQEKSKGARLNSIYTVSFFEQLRLCTIRKYNRTWGDKPYTITLIFSAIAQAFIVGSLYYNTPDDVSGAFSRGGIVFFSTLYMSLMGLSQISASFRSRPILMKHKNYTLYHPSADALGNFIISIPLTILVNSLFVVILYLLSNLARDVGKFFIAYLFIILLNLTSGCLFQAIASLNKTISSANAFAGVMVLASLMYSSFVIQRPSMHPWFKWISYVNPVLYSFEAIVANEFHGRRMECSGEYITPSGPGYENLGPGQQVCAAIGSVPGQSWVSGDNYIKSAFTFEFSHVWRNLGILFGFLFFFLAVNALGTEYVKPISGGGDKLLYLRGKVPDHLANASDKQQRDLEGGPAVGDLEKVPGQANDSDLDDLKVEDIFVWKDVDYVIPYDGAERKLLDQVSGFCVPGTLTALMGESGAGKTTLLNTLAQRIDFGVVTGDMLVNGKPLDSSFSRRTGYVQQQDIHVTEVTVRESLQFAARLRRPQDVSDEEKLNYVEKIIDVLDMNDYADAVVGRSGNGLNVEQRKKLSIGVELVAKPTLLLFLDEPTSGLDSQSAWAIVKLLRDLANAGQSILCTIHQPSATLFEEFDRLLLLRKGGQTVYFGDIGPRSRTILSYFERNGARACDDHENPAEYILEAIGAGATAVTEYDWFKIWTQSPEKREADAKRDQLILVKAESSNHTSSDSKDLQRKYATGYFYQFRYVWHRNAMTFFRDPVYIAAKIFLMSFSGLFIGFTFFGLKETRTGNQNGMFCAFLSVVVSAPVTNQIQAKAYAGRELFEVREKLSNTYHWSLLLINQLINELPYLFIGAAIMFVSVYFPTQVDTSPSQSSIFYLTQGIFLPFFAASFGLMILYMAPNLETANVLVSFFYTFIVSFAGVVQPVTIMPEFWKFMYKVSPYTYFIQNLATSFLHGRPIHCSDEELAYFNPPAGATCGQFAGPFAQVGGGYLIDANVTTQCGYCSLSNADQYLWTIRAKYSYRWRNVGFFVAYIIFNISACLVLYYLLRYRKIFNNMGNPLNVFKRKKD